MKISLCMIVKNEEHNLENCLNSVVDLVDEVIIVDTGSSDNTVKIAKKYTNNVYNFKWVDNFSMARNFAYSKATMDYIMWLDADDIILEKDRQLFSDLKQNFEDNIDVVMLKYNTQHDENGNSVFSYYRERITKRANNYVWHEPVHECLKIWGNIVNKEIAITHTKNIKEADGRNLKIYEKEINSGKQLSTRGSYYYARELKDNNKINEAINQFNLFLESGKGLTDDNISACKALADCYIKLGKHDNALKILFKSFIYDTPRAEICLNIAYIYKHRQAYDSAIFWLKTILTLNKPKDCWGFINNDAWGYIPCLELVLIYDHLKEYKLAEDYNERAAVFKPYSNAVEHNRRYFNSLKEIKV